MKNITVFSFVLVLLTVGCNISKSKIQLPNDDNRMELKVTKIQNEMDGQTIFMEDEKGGRYNTIISPANGNWVVLNIGDKVSLLAIEIMESYPAQIISKDIKVLNNESYINSIKTKITTSKSVYKKGEVNILYFEIKNTGKEPFTFLPWGTPLENRFTGDCLEVKHNGKSISYGGIMVKRMPPTESDFITLQANETATGEVQLLNGYKIDSKGRYTIQFKEKYKGIPASNIIELEIK